MKTIQLFIGLLFISFASVTGQSKAPATVSENIKVWGNCGMCKAHIEKAAKQAGASTAVWNKDTKVLAVKYAASKTSNTKIQESVAAAGYDTQDMTGSDEAYKNLDECCQYDRKATAPNAGKLSTAASCCDKNAVCDKTKCKPGSNMDCCKNAAVKHDCMKNTANSCCAKTK
jgi:mercuric ion binding protein